VSTELQDPPSEKAKEPKTRPKREAKPTHEIWLLPSADGWQLGEQQADGSLNILEDELAPDAAPSSKPTMVAIPAAMVTCQLFWLESLDEKVIANLVEVQCERFALAGKNGIVRHRILHVEGERSLVQVIALSNALPALLEASGTPGYEAYARCLQLPAHAVCIWKAASRIVLALTDGAGELVYFQALTNPTLDDDALRDVGCIILMAEAQRWIDTVTEVHLAGNWQTSELGGVKRMLELPVREVDRFPLRKPRQPMDLTPRTVEQRRRAASRRRKLGLFLSLVVAGYLLFVVLQIVNFIGLKATNAQLQADLDRVMPSVTSMQRTALQMDALAPAWNPEYFPLEILNRLTTLLPERGVRLTRFEIKRDRIEIAGESSTAREAFRYMQSVQEAEDLEHITWDDPPQPVPLPNNTTRFSLQGELENVWPDEET